MHFPSTHVVRGAHGLHSVTERKKFPRVIKVVPRGHTHFLRVASGTNVSGHAAHPETELGGEMVSLGHGVQIRVVPMRALPGGQVEGQGGLAQMARQEDRAAFGRLPGGQGRQTEAPRLGEK